MIVLIQGSNRKGNATRPVVDVISKYLTGQGEAVTEIDLEFLPGSILHSGMYESGLSDPYLDAAEKSLRAADRWIFVFPEYNGSYPGAMKLFIDALSVREYETLFGAKTAALIGTASGRAGNLRGIDHFTGVLHHLGTTVMPQSLPISLIDTLLDSEGAFADKEANAALQGFLDRFLRYGIVGEAVEV